MEKEEKLFFSQGRLDSALANEEELQKALADEKALREILAVDEESMRRGYRIGCVLLEQKRNEEAADLFLLLTALDPSLQEYWVGLGMAWQLLQKFEEAIDAYEMAATCLLSNPIPYFYLAKCFFALHERDSAAHALDLAIEYSEEVDEYAELYSQAKEAKEGLEKSS